MVLASKVPTTDTAGTCVRKVNRSAVGTLQINSVLMVKRTTWNIRLPDLASRREPRNQIKSNCEKNLSKLVPSRNATVVLSAVNAVDRCLL